MYRSIAISISILLLMMLGCSSGSNDQLEENASSNNVFSSSNVPLSNLSVEFAALPIEALSEDESKAIIFMREEEKLARDSYELFYQFWNQNIFNNIASAEQTHMDSMLLLIERYQLVDPIGEDQPGIFTDLELQNLYNVLSAQGSNSLVNALIAGAEIEEVDLIDIEIRYAESDNQDIQLIFENLMKGSRNHLRSFVSNLDNQGIIYSPQYLTQEAYDAIINSPMETGHGG